MRREEFDETIIALKQAEHAREQADILEETLAGRERDAYSEICVNIVAENIREEEGFCPDGVGDAE